MEALIREGTLRMQTSEACCDVILSCQGNRLMAHKVILSIASPLLRNLLLQDCTEPSVLIFPDINANIMSLILDYIYSGSVIVYSNTINDFLAAADLLKLQVDVEFLEKYFHNCKSENAVKLNKEELRIKKSRRKVPDLLPIKKPLIESRKKMANSVIPSPWQPRMMPLLSDPRTTDCFNGARLISEKIEKNDANNNFQPELNVLPTNLSTTFINTLSNFRKSIKSSLELDLTTSINKVSFKPKLLPHILKNSSKLKFEKKEHLEKSTKWKSDSEDFKDKKNPIKKQEESNEEEKRDSKHKPFKCDDCGKSFSQLRNYKYHRSVHEGTKEFAAKCPECGKVFNDRGYLSSHMKIHRDRKEYACPHCPKRFNQRVAYNMHLRIHTGVKPHECPTCGKSFSRKMLLKQHQRVHTGERPYSCPDCGKTFADRSNMSLHARLHTGVKPYSCNLCSKSFTKKHHLKTHMNFHTGLKPYSCQKCGLAFSQSSNMRTHFKKCVMKETAGDANNSNVDSM